jgi:hypothetical protein
MVRMTYAGAGRGEVAVTGAIVGLACSLALPPHAGRSAPQTPLSSPELKRCYRPAPNFARFLQT